jgi:hypothetical protein
MWAVAKDAQMKVAQQLLGNQGTYKTGKVTAQAERVNLLFIQETLKR